MNETEKRAMAQALRSRGSSHPQAKILLVRHGDTDYNSDASGERIRGWLNVPLNDKGREQARELGEKFKSDPIVAIYTSDLDRANDVAEQIRTKNKNRKDLTIVKTRALRPWNLGEFQGKPVESSLKKIRAYVDDTPDEAVPGGESFKDFYTRTLKFARARIAQAEKNPGSVVMLVSHTRVLRLITAWVQHGMKDDFNGAEIVGKKNHAGPGGFEVLLKKNGKWGVAEIEGGSE